MMRAVMIFAVAAMASVACGSGAVANEPISAPAIPAAQGEGAAAPARSVTQAESGGQGRVAAPHAIVRDALRLAGAGQGRVVQPVVIRPFF